MNCQYNFPFPKIRYNEKKLARQWVQKNIPKKEWYIWEANLQISMNKYRSNEDKQTDKIIH